VDGVSAAEFHASLEENLERLMVRAKTCDQYRAPHARTRDL